MLKEVRKTPVKIEIYSVTGCIAFFKGKTASGYDAV
jgi:hypothetical protein